MEQKAVKAAISYPVDGQNLASVAGPGTGAVHCFWQRVEVRILWKTIWYEPLETAVSIPMIRPLYSKENDLTQRSARLRWGDF